MSEKRIRDREKHALPRDEEGGEVSERSSGNRKRHTQAKDKETRKVSEGRTVDREKARTLWRQEGGQR